MSHAYGYSSVIHRIVIYTSDACSKWMPTYSKEFSSSKTKWLNRNNRYIKIYKKLYRDLVKLSSLTPSKARLKYTRIIAKALNIYKTSLTAQELSPRNQFCLRFFKRLDGGAMDISNNVKATDFMDSYYAL